MTRALLPSFKAIWLSTLLTFAYPSWAQAAYGVKLDANQALRCAQLLAGEQGAQSPFPSITQFINKNGLNIEFQGQRKSAFFAPVSSWGRGENAKHLFVFAMRVSSNEEALTFFKQLISKNNLVNGTQWSVGMNAENVFEVPGVCTARVHSPYYARHIPMAQGPLELEVEIDKSVNEVEVAAQISAALFGPFHLRVSRPNLQHLTSYDLSTYEDRAAWGYEAFHEWLNSLSSEARTALTLISGPDYRDVLPFLRGKGRSGPSSVSTPQLQKLVGELDLAIERGKIPVPVKLYRASADPLSLDAWNQLSTNENVQVQQYSDLAYTFTSLDEQFVQSWNRNELRGLGIIIEIEASAGVKLGYVDRGPQTRDYAEIILARGQELTPVRAYTTSSGEKRLVVTAH